MARIVITEYAEPGNQYLAHALGAGAGKVIPYKVNGVNLEMVKIAAVHVAEDGQSVDLTLEGVFPHGEDAQWRRL